MDVVSPTPSERRVANPSTAIQGAFPEKVLLVAATEIECAPTLREMVACKTIYPWLYEGTLHGKPVEMLISGIGAVATTFRLTQTLMQHSYTHAVSIGIAGSFTDDLPIGDVVQITEDCFADLGIDDNGQFLNLRKAVLDTDKDFAGDFIMNPFPTLSPLRKVRGITVQTASGSLNRINSLVARLHPDVETMENAAFFYVCMMMQVPFASFRAISNKVEPRKRENWRITEAIGQINLLIRNLI